MAAKATRPTVHQRKPRRRSRRVLPKTLLSIARPVSVEREEEVLEIGLVTVEREHLVARQRLDQWIGGPLKRKQHNRPLSLELAHTGEPGEGLHRRRLAEGRLDPHEGARPE